MLLPEKFPVTSNTKHIQPGGTFVAIKGFKEDGTKYIHEAIEKGATTIVIEGSFTPQNLPTHIKIIFVDNARKALATLSAQALDNPATKLKFIGITGTAGKTTTTYLIDHLLSHAGYKTALLGTIKNKIGKLEEPSSLTTPDSDYIQMFLAECVKNGIDYVIMEISSHSIALDRIYGIEFDNLGFTNLSPEHMDFHPNMEHYFQTKAKLFYQLKDNGTATINTDDSWGAQLFNMIPHGQAFGSQQQFISTAYHKTTQFSITENTRNGLSLSLINNTTNTIHCPTLFGQYNGYNICMATLICKNLGITQDKINSGLASFPGVPGRLQPHTLANGAKAFVDYAHKPGAFEAVLKTLRPLSPHLIVVFGCGGDRDTTKRPIMGKLAADYADLVIITDDNPRNEDREAIVHAIMAGVAPVLMPKVIIELDRKKAIALAAEKSQPESIIAILGKGHENYYLIKGQKLHLDDMEEISRF